LNSSGRWKRKREAKLTSDYDTVKDFLALDIAEMPVWELIDRMKGLVNEIVENSDIAIMSAFEKQYGHRTAHQLFDFVMNDQDGFRAKRADRVNMLFQVCEIYIRNSPIHRNNYERVFTFVTSLNIAIYFAVYNAEVSFEAFNGQIAKIINNDNN